jgi:hypothetical protein
MPFGTHNLVFTTCTCLLGGTKYKPTSLDRSGVVLGNFIGLQFTMNLQERAHHDQPVLFCAEIVIMVVIRSQIFSCEL